MEKGMKMASEVVNIFPPYIPKEIQSKKALAAIKILQELDTQSLGAREVAVKILEPDPINIYVIGDLHIGSLSTNHDSLANIRDAILKPGVYAVLIGDLLEGVDATKKSTTKSPLDLQQQAMVLREELLKPLTEKGKILAAVSDHFAHEGWLQEQVNVDPWSIMFAGLKINRLQQGGRVKVVLKSGESFLMELSHSPNGKSEIDPVHGLRKKAFGESIGTRPDVFIAGHLHVSATAKELYPGSGDYGVVYISGGTIKGVDKNVPPDRFGIKLGGGKEPSPLGQGFIARKKETPSALESVNLFPYHEGTVGNKLHMALRLLEKVDRQKMRTELLSQIRNEVQKSPVVRFNKKESVISGSQFREEPNSRKSDSNGEGERRVPVDGKLYADQYQQVVYDIGTRVPIVYDPIQNVRDGSHDSGLEKLREHVKTVLEPDEFVFGALLRSMIDSEAGKDCDRETILRGVVNLLYPARKRLLAILLSEDLRKGEWKRVLHEKLEDGEKIDYDPIAPGSYLSRNLDTPLVQHLSHILLRVGPPEVKPAERTHIDIVTADKLNRSGSVAKPTQGHRRLYDWVLQRKPSFIGGGHMPAAGYLTFYDESNPTTKSPTLMEPGWYAKSVDTLGKGNIFAGAQPGQMMIIMPGKGQRDYMVFPAINEDETKVQYDALTLLMGLDFLGITDKVTKRNYRKS